MNAIASGSHVTLHYRLAVLGENGEREILSTLDSKPATLQLGDGSLSAAIEERLVGLHEGDERAFDLPADAAFGARSESLVQALTPDAFDACASRPLKEGPGEGPPRIGDVVEVRAPDGRRSTGVLVHRDPQRVVVDFNHPLAGRAIRFSVRVIGVL